MSQNTMYDWNLKGKTPHVRNMFRPFCWSKILGGFLVDRNGQTYPTNDLLTGKRVILFFGDQGYGTKDMSDLLEEFVGNLSERDTNFEVVYIPRELNKFQYIDDVKSMPWKSLPFYGSRNPVVGQLEVIFNWERKTPNLIILEKNGDVTSYHGRNLIENDPKGLAFPWRPVSPSFTMWVWQAFIR